jgi:hypothetical protein
MAVADEVPDAELLKIPKTVLQLSRQSMPHEAFEPDDNLFPYFGGRIPLAWMERAAKLPGKAFHVGVLLWHLRRLQRSTALVVRLESRWYPRFGLHRNTVGRALALLAREGLIALDRGRGAPGEVTLVVPEPLSGNGSGHRCVPNKGVGGDGGRA